MPQFIQLTAWDRDELQALNVAHITSYRANPYLGGVSVWISSMTMEDEGMCFQETYEEVSMLIASFLSDEDTLMPFRAAGERYATGFPRVGKDA